MGRTTEPKPYFHTFTVMGGIFSFTVILSSERLSYGCWKEKKLKQNGTNFKLHFIIQKKLNKPKSENTKRFFGLKNFFLDKIYAIQAM